ncbi:hypothetical protein [Culicoidibacter larvae]|uniref:LPXTG cell wall anchor domain-containing protein n=1 Tax=Culicoidibacter larvae TaxID=2579976 RepID=A0A5R8QBI7_9FIRM|nr:hypothetical protein [Culicoidibacter larvae]TLG72985.1 hypothetical protein FEZ08_08035 [Culicoidibacter larvae]
MKKIMTISMLSIMLAGLSLMTPVQADSSENNNSEVNMTELVIEAKDFTIPLSDVAALTAETVMDENHAQVNARLGLAMIYIYPTVNEAEFAALQSATTAGVYPLTFYADYGDQQHVETTISVTVEDSNMLMVILVGVGAAVIVVGAVIGIFYARRK